MDPAYFEALKDYAGLTLIGRSGMVVPVGDVEVAEEPDSDGTGTFGM